MATASNTATSAGETAGNSNVPQWKRDLIQRRRQQSKVLASNGASVKLCSAVIGSSSNVTSETADIQEQCAARVIRSESDANNLVNISNNSNNNGGVIGGVAASTALFSRAAASGGAIVGTATPSADFASPVACNMRLDADLSVCASDAEDVLNGVSSKETERKSESDEGDESTRQDKRTRVSSDTDNMEDSRGTTRGNSFAENLCKPKMDRKFDVETRNKSPGENDGESDSSEELQYGPGIVNKLKSKYLNLTLREMNKSRATVQRFRRAASLEDLLDCEEDTGEKTARKYTKRNAGVTVKNDRYRNASRGNESMKRARSVETLMRYNAEESCLNQQTPGNRSTNGLRQEPVNDHIILVDRTTVKIESRLGELDRPKPVNKPKRIKPVLAETERPPPDLVKTTMRIFEGSAKKLKPKGEVAAKVATFKTINDTFKAQNAKKIVPKPPLQPKPFVNGNSRPPGSPKKIVLPQKPTAELIEKQLGQEEYHIDGVITEPVIQSVSSVVSKFQQIEKGSHSPSPSPEPSYKFKFSPAPSPEPKLKPGLEISVKSPPVTPVLSPRIASPRVLSPPSPIKDTSRQTSITSQRVQSPPSPVRDIRQSPVLKRAPSPTKEQKQSVLSEKIVRVEKELKSEHPRQQVSERIQSPDSQEVKEESKEPVEIDKEESTVEEEEEEEQNEEDRAKTISKSALDNIGKAGITMQFSFSDKPIGNKSYLPGTKQNGQKEDVAKVESKVSKPSSFVTSVESIAETRLQERLEAERNVERTESRKVEEEKEIETKIATTESSKPIGAICSLGLIKSSTTTASYPQVNETKTIRCQKTTESPPQKQIGIIRPLVSTKAQHPQQNLSNRELEKNLINRVKSIEQPTKVVVSLKSADEIQPAKKSTSAGGLWDSKPWNQHNNTMVFNFSNRKDVPDYIENDGLIIRRKKEKPKVGEGGIIVLDATLDASTTDDAELEISGGPPSPCDVSFLNDNILINGRSNLSRTPRNHKHRIQFDDTATRTFEYPSEASMLEGDGSSVDGETSGSVEQSTPINNKTSTASNTTTSMPPLLGGGGLASYTPSKVDLTSEGFELGVTRAVPTTPISSAPPATGQTMENASEMDYLKPAQDAGAWGSETTGDLLY